MLRSEMLTDVREAVLHRGLQTASLGKPARPVSLHLHQLRVLRGQCALHGAHPRRHARQRGAVAGCGLQLGGPLPPFSATPGLPC